MNGTKESLLREARAASALDHPNTGFDSPLYDQNGNPVTSQPLTANTCSAPLTGRGTNKEVKFFTSMNMNAGKEHAHGHGGVGGGSGSIKIGG